MNQHSRVAAFWLQPIHRTLPFGKLKGFILLFVLFFSAIGAFAQNTPRQTPPPPLPFREISGIVKDSTDLGVIGATVSLTSDKDTLKVSTNADGIFVFRNVKSATYTILVQSIGYKASSPMRYRQNDAIPRIIMDPIILKEQKNTLNEVVITGTASIVYKTDTVEYKASDYIVRKNATVDELLKKMEGMEVGTDGSLVHQGQNVTKAKLNGKEYLGGDIANAIKNLPAEIVDRIQVVDDYGDQAARTGVKDGDPEKVLNITTRTDKSVGNMANISVGAGNNKRYENSLFATRINGNQTIGVNGRLNNTVNGVAASGDNSSGSGGGFGGGGGGGGGGGRGNGGGGGGGNAGSSGGSGGTTTTGLGNFSYRDKLSEKVNINMNYGFTTTDRNTINNSSSTIFPTETDVTYQTRMGITDTKTNSHNFRLELEANLDSANFLRIIPTVRYNYSNSSSVDSILQTGSNHQDQFTNNATKSTTPQIGGSIFYQHIFKKPRRNISFQVDINSNNQDNKQIQQSQFIYYENTTTNKNADVNQTIERKNLQDNYRGSLTYVEPLTVNTQLELNAQINYNGYDNKAITSDILANGSNMIVDSLSNIYKYSFTQSRIALNYRFGLSNMSKVRFSVGVTALPAVLSGTKESLGTTIHRNSFNVFPIARFEYLWSRQHRLQVNYSGNAVEPTFDQIQPVRDVSSPTNPVIGNPDLLAAFTHSINANYNNYIANSKLNYSMNLNASLTDNAVIRNTVQVRGYGPGSNVLINMNETRFVNMNGVYRVNANYSVNKQLNDRKYNLALSGSVNYNHNLSLLKGVKNVTNILTLVERFGPRINPTEWFEINPNVSYNYTRADNSSLKDANNKTNTIALNLDGRVYLWDTFLVGYSASKNYVRGISSNITTNPFVINMYLEKELFERRGKVTVQAFDLLNQNNFVSRENTGTAIIDTKSNALSRYFMVRLSMRLQKWTGATGRNGNGVMRRGDGSFM